MLEFVKLLRLQSDALSQQRTAEDSREPDTEAAASVDLESSSQTKVLELALLPPARSGLWRRKSKKKNWLPSTFSLPIAVPLPLSNPSLFLS